MPLEMAASNCHADVARVAGDVVASGLVHAERLMWRPTTTLLRITSDHGDSLAIMDKAAGTRKSRTKPSTNKAAATVSARDRRVAILKQGFLVADPSVGRSDYIGRPTRRAAG